MRFLSFIAILFFAVLVASCTKPDDDSPYDQVPASITDEGFRDFEENIEPLEEPESDEPIQIFINDDGDDESGPSTGVVRISK